MARHRNDKTETKTAGNDLEPYRRLVELQKQMIELAQQHEQTKRRRDALREVVDQRQRPVRPGLRERLLQSAAKLWQRVPGLTAEKPDLGTLNNKQPSSC